MLCVYKGLSLSVRIVYNKKMLIVKIVDFSYLLFFNWFYTFNFKLIENTFRA